MPALLPGELAWYVTGRFYAMEQSPTEQSLADYGYFLHLAGIDRDQLFDGEPGETTARFTFAAHPFVASGVANGTLTLALDPVGDFSVYLQRSPAGTFDDPQSFAQGERIARFRRTSLVVGTTVDTGATAPAQSQPLISNNVFSAWLVESAPFELGGKRHDLAETLGRGVTQFGTASATPIQPALLGYSLVVPFSGSAIALAGGNAG